MVTYHCAVRTGKVRCCRTDQIKSQTNLYSNTCRKRIRGDCHDNETKLDDDGAVIMTSDNACLLDGMPYITSGAISRSARCNVADGVTSVFTATV